MSENLPTENEKKILVVDDKEAMIESIKRGLRMLGHKFETFLNPITALEIFRENPNIFNLVITDLEMLEMNGEELAEEIRKIRPKIQIIFATAAPDKLKSEHKIVLEKPFTPEDLQSAVRKALDAAAKE